MKSYLDIVLERYGRLAQQVGGRDARKELVRLFFSVNEAISDDAHLVVGSELQKETELGVIMPMSFHASFGISRAC